MEEMTELDLKAAHITLWQWLYEHPDKTICDWPGWEVNGRSFLGLINNSFACAVAKMRGPSGACEHRCPLDQQKIKGCYVNKKGALQQWKKEKSIKKKQKYAAIIRDAWLPTSY